MAAPAFSRDGVRPVNLRTDLRPLADLIELVFADSMDSSGRSAIREMRYLSSLGYGLKLIARLNELALGISLGFVYVLDGKLVGNVSVYPANYPVGFGDGLDSGECRRPSGLSAARHRGRVVAGEPGDDPPARGGSRNTCR